jgi:hypothetical protein
MAARDTHARSTVARNLATKARLRQGLGVGTMLHKGICGPIKDRESTPELARWPLPAGSVGWDLVGLAPEALRDGAESRAVRLLDLSAFDASDGLFREVAEVCPR